MPTFQGTLQTTDSRELPLKVSVQIDGDRIRMWSDRRRIGSWDSEQVNVKRESIFRFLLSIEQDVYGFSPEDPSGFAQAVHVEIDLTTTPRARFGLADRLRQMDATG